MQHNIIYLPSSYSDLLGFDANKTLQDLLDPILTGGRIIKSFSQSKQKGSDPCIEIAILSPDELIDIEIGKSASTISAFALNGIKLINLSTNPEKTRVEVGAPSSDGLIYYYDAYSPTKIMEIREFYTSLITQWRVKNVCCR